MNPEPDDDSQAGDTLLYSEVSPNGNIQACVEQDDQVVFFYLHGAPETPFSVKSCWVRNLVAAPRSLETERMQMGLAPLLPRNCCAHPQGASPLNPEHLRIVWFEEGDAATLFLDSEVLAIIPAWSGVEGFHGYARDCIAESPLCWPMPTERALFERIERAEAFWRSWEEGDPWTPLQEAMVDAYGQQLGPCSNYYAIDGGAWPPKALLRIPQDGGVALVTAGMCIRPQPQVEMHVQQPELHRRIELGLCLSSEFSADVVRAAMEYLSGQSNYPWNRYTWLGHSHTFPIDVILPGPDGEPFPFVLLEKQLPNSPMMELPEFDGDHVSLLWMIPITQGERAFAEAHGSEALSRLLVNSGVGLMHRGRRGVV